MGLESQFKRTTGIVYGELMRDSGISLNNGLYIVGTDLISELRTHAVMASMPVMLKDFSNIAGYGKNDNVLTGVQYLEMRLSEDKFRKAGIHASGSSTYFFNPWKELMNGSSLGDLDSNFHIADRKKTFEVLKSNPREGVERIRNMYILFTSLPKSLREDYLSMVDSFPCDLDEQIYDPNSFIGHIMEVVRRRLERDGLSREYFSFLPPEERNRLSKIHEQIREHTPEEHRGDINYILKLLAIHNFCAGKGDVVRSQIENLVGYDTTKIPTAWERTHLEGASITPERVRELNRVISRRKEPRI